ncbi:MAG: site-specific integrase [Lachnospiraceae bacterium]|nr:site-specific integrase [Lachnospiraceae bacterium]
MGKDINGKELGRGLAQRKDGRYSARFVSKSGKRVQEYFPTLSQARNRLREAQYDDVHSSLLDFDLGAEIVLNGDGSLPAFDDLTVDQWFEFWINNIVPDLRSNTLRNYRDRYKFNIQPVLGKLKVKDVRPLHCKKVLLDMDDDYAGSTIRQTYNAMGTLFKAALMNGIINKHPMDGVRYTKQCKSASDIKVLTLDEQDKFMKQARWSHNYDQYSLILETGLRAGELIGLTWDSVDLKNKTITIDKTLEYRHSRGTWEAGPPKTTAGYRTIPLTSRAYSILTKLYDARKRRKESPELDTRLEFKDRLTGEIRYLNMKDLVFINYRTGLPTKNSSYNTHLYKLCEAAGIKQISMHVLRHTFATRAIERGVNSKALQKLLGHASLQVTMDTYVHVTDDSKKLAIEQFEGKAAEAS